VLPLSLQSFTLHVARIPKEKREHRERPSATRENHIVTASFVVAHHSLPLVVSRPLQHHDTEMNLSHPVEHQLPAEGQHDELLASQLHRFVSARG
jgi:hypothetical protein